MAYGVSNSRRHVTRKVKLVTPIRLEHGALYIENSNNRLLDTLL